MLPAGNLLTAVAYPPTAVGYPPTAVGYPPTAVGYPPTAVAYPPTAVAYPPTAVAYPPTAVAYPPTAVAYPPTVEMGLTDAGIFLLFSLAVGDRPALQGRPWAGGYMKLRGDAWCAAVRHRRRGAGGEQEHGE